MTYAYAWAPVLAAILGIASMVLTGISKLTAAADKLKNSEEFKQLKDQIKSEREENKLLRNQLKVIEEKLKGFDDKADAIIRGEEIIHSYERADHAELEKLCARLNILYSEVLKGVHYAADNTEAKEELSDC